jgi:hypothetical protein
VTGISFPDNLAAYLSNLQGLGILQVRTDIYLADKELYESLEFESKARFKVKEMEDGTEPKMSITFKKGKIDVTPFGGLFLQACFAK